MQTVKAIRVPISPVYVHGGSLLSRPLAIWILKCPLFKQKSSNDIKFIYSKIEIELDTLFYFHVMSYLISTEEESIDSKYTVLNCADSNFAHCIQNNFFNLVFAEIRRHEGSVK